MKDELLNLDSLTEEERQRILDVLKRNEELQSAQDNRITEIKSEINAIRMNAVLRQGEDGTKICARCREPFGFFFNTGELCPQCKCKVCKKCREYTLKGDWICTLCYKQRQLKALTGEWLVPVPAEEEENDNQRKSAPDLVRESISGRNSQASDTEDGSYHADGNGTSRISHYPPFDESSYRAHSDLPDIDDLIAKSKARRHHSPLSSMTSSPTPSSTGQRLLDLANSAANSDAVSLTASDQTDVSSVTGNLTATSQGSSPLPSIVLSSPDTNEVEGEEEEVDDTVSQHRPPSSTFHQTFGSLFSSLGGSRESIASYYSQAGGGTYGVVQVKGTIQFAVDYKHKVGTLEVVVKQCTEIAAVDEKKQRSDPYVKTYLLPDRTRTGKRKTGVRKNTLDPVFNETLRYHLTKSELSNRTLWLSVWNHDRLGHNVFLGEVTLPLTYYTFSNLPQWYNLQDREEMEPSMMTYKGDLILSIKYIPLENLSDIPEEQKKKKKPKEGQLCVLIKEAKNLTAVRANGYSDSFCKGYLLPEKGKSLKQKTTVVKKNLSPKWNYLFTFDDISFEELPDRCLELTVWDHDRFSSNDFLGGVRLNLGTGRSKSKDVDWMDGRGEEISIWQTMLDKPNTWVEGTLTLRANMDKVE